MKDTYTRTRHRSSPTSCTLKLGRSAESRRCRPTCCASGSRSFRRSPPSGPPRGSAFTPARRSNGSWRSRSCCTGAGSRLRAPVKRLRVGERRRAGRSPPVAGGDALRAGAAAPPPGLTRRRHGQGVSNGGCRSQNRDCWRNLLTRFCVVVSSLLEMSGHSSAGRVQASQAWCREFESRCPLHPCFSVLLGRFG